MKKSDFFDVIAVTIGKNHTIHVAWRGNTTRVWCGREGELVPQSHNISHVTCKDCIKQLKEEGLA